MDITITQEHIDVFLRLLEEALTAEEAGYLPSSISEDVLSETRKDIIYLSSQAYFDDINSRRTDEEKKASEEIVRQRLKEMEIK